MGVDLIEELRGYTRTTNDQIAIDVAAEDKCRACGHIGAEVVTYHRPGTGSIRQFQKCQDCGRWEEF